MNRIAEAYPEAAHLFRPGDEERGQDLLKSMSKAGLTEWIRKSTKTYDINERPYQMLEDTPEEGDGEDVFVVTGEFSNGPTRAVVARAQVAREMYNPNATLIIYPNTNGIKKMPNFSWGEDWKLMHGDATPAVDRLRNVIDRIRPDKLTILGPSQGAVVASEYAYHPDTQRANIAVVEAPNVKNRSAFKLLRDFAGSGKSLNDTIRLNFAESDHPLAKQLPPKAADLAIFVSGFFRPDNIGLVGVMRKPTLARGMLKALEKGAGVVHAWGTVDNVSGDATNTYLRKRFQDKQNYEGFRFEGHGHDLTNAFTLIGELARYAAELSPPPKAV